MKYFLLSLLAVLFSLSTTLSRAQDQNNPTDGTVCLDIVEKLNSNSLTGNKILVWQCCGGIKLFAKLRIQSSGRSKKTIASNWQAEDAHGAKLGIEPPRNRTRTVTLKGNLKEKITEQLLMINSQKLCFVVEQKREIAK